jgi:hypothetical protein
MRISAEYLYAWIAVLAGLLAGCDHSASAQTTLRQTAEEFVPQDASEKVVAPDLPWVQISFKVLRPWLVFAVDERRISEAKLAGWALCQPASAEWNGYEDHATTPPNYRRLRTYVLYRDGVLLQLIGIYDTPIDTMGLGKRDEKPVQQGFVIARTATPNEVFQTAKNFDLSCDMQAEGRRP